MKRSILLLLVYVVLLTACGAPTPPLSTTPIDTGVDPSAWARIPAGPFLRGQHQHPASIPADFEIMITDVTNAQYATYLTQALAQGKVRLAGDTIVGYYAGDPFHGARHEEKIEAGDWLHIPFREPGSKLTFDGKTFRPLPGYENHPVVMVTWFGAKAYCEAQGGRLPSDDEWEKAARGTDDRPFPWGNQLERNQANYYSSRDIFEKVFGKQGDTTPVGFYNGKTYSGYITLAAASPYGLYDMAGNVWQWVSTITPGTHYRFLRGGSKADYGYNLRIWSRNSARPDYAAISIGFRCARDVK